jgi:hypothetical protein
MKVEYVSMIAQAQKAAAVSSLVQGLNYAATVGATQPEVLNRIDYACALEEGLKALGVAPALLKDPEDSLDNPIISPNHTDYSSSENK